MIPSNAELQQGLENLQNFVEQELVNRNIILQGTDDPTQSPGVTAPITAYYWRTSNNTRYEKIGSGDTAWQLVGSGGGGMTVSYITSATTLADNTLYFVNFAGGVFNLTMPASPTTTLNIIVQVVGGDIEALPSNQQPVLLRNSTNIMGLAEDMILNANYARFTISYSPVSGRGFVIS